MNMQRVLIPAALVGAAAAAAAGVLYYTGGLNGGARRLAARAGIGRGRATVRVTENGRKYHRSDCPLLHVESQEIPVAEAVQNYEPCKACHPPGM
jgi:hypothetical protein